MKIRKIIIIFILFPFVSFCQFESKKTYVITRVIESPIIDGIVNDKVWEEITIANNFTQITPKNGEKERANQKTEVKICYDSKNIYFAVTMYDNASDSILKELSQRDEDNKNFDAFGIFIDPFNDGQVEYNFMVTAAGVQIDRKFSKSGIDKNWNAVWKSAVKINSIGWVAEFAIPFSQLRFSEKSDIWALNMARTIRRYREDYSWNPINVKFTDFALQAGILKGIKNITPPTRLSFMPYASMYADNFEGETTYPYNYGMDLKYGLNKSFTLDMTLIPDFGQTVSDAMVLNLTPFEVKYEENRQFFNEGTELFSKGEDMFYSRRLENNLLNASKITGRTENGLGIAILNAVTNKTDTDPLTNYNAMIFDQSLGNGSSVSLMNTHMVKNGSNKDANVTGAFARINNKENTHVYVGKLKISQEFEKGKITRGFSGMLAVGKTNGNYRYDVYSIFEDDKYNPNDLGFLYSNNEIKNGLSLSYNQLTESKRFIDLETEIEIEHKSLFTDQKFVNLELEFEQKATLKNHTTIFVRANINPYEENDFYETRTNHLLNPVKRSKSIYLGGWISTDYRKKIALDFGGGYSLKPLYEGYLYRWRLAPRFRLNDKISMRYILSIKKEYNDIGFITYDTLPLLIEPPKIDYIFAKRNTNMITNVFSLNYILSNKMDLSIKVRYHLDQVRNIEYNKLDDNGYLYESQYVGNYDINYSTWTSDIVFNWWFSPGSQLSLVWKNGIDNTENYITNHWIENLNNSFKLEQQNSISLKIIYYLDYLYFKNDKS